MENENKEISKVKIDNQIYNIKDLYVREKLRELLGDDYMQEPLDNDEEN